MYARLYSRVCAVSLLLTGLILPQGIGMRGMSPRVVGVPRGLSTVPSSVTS